MTAPTTAMVTRDEFLAELTKRYGDQITALAPQGATPAHYAASLRLYAATNPGLLKCTKKSVMVGMLRVAQTGLELGVTCDLLTFKDTAQFSPRYQGIVELALGAGTRVINADVVRKGDEFIFEKGTRPYMKHVRHAAADAEVTGAYAIGEIRVNSFAMVYLTRDEIEDTRKRYSKKWWAKKDGTPIPLETIPWYGRKTAIRRLAEYLPKNARLAAALLFADEKPEEEIPDGVSEPIPPDVDTETGEIHGLPEGTPPAEEEVDL